jgi:phospholipase/carboxylesterase
MHDLVPLAAELGESRFRFVFPQAPVELPGYPSGRAWFPRDERELTVFAAGAGFSDLASYDPDGLGKSAAELAGLLDHLGADPAQTVIGGFSQGSMVACELVFGSHWHRPAGLLIMSGSLIAEQRWESSTAVLAGVPVLQTHGTLDPVLPFSEAERLAALLRAGGADHQFITFPGGHGIPGAVVEEIVLYLDRLFG